MVIINVGNNESYSCAELSTLKRRHLRKSHIRPFALTRKIAGDIELWRYLPGEKIHGRRVVFLTSVERTGSHFLASLLQSAGEVGLKVVVLTRHYDSMALIPRGLRGKIGREHLLDYISLTIEKCRRLLTDRALDSSICRIEYEQLAEAPHRLSGNGLFQFLSLPQMHVVVSTVKVLHESPSELVTNYASVRDIFEGLMGQMPSELCVHEEGRKTESSRCWDRKT